MTTGFRAVAVTALPVTVDDWMLAWVSSVRLVIETEPTMDRSLVVVLDKLAEIPVATAVRSPPFKA